MSPQFNKNKNSKSRNIYKGTMDEDNMRGGGLNVGERGAGRAGESSGGKRGQLKWSNNKNIFKS